MSARTDTSTSITLMLAVMMMAAGGPARGDTHATAVWPNFTAILGPPDGVRTTELYPEGVDIYVGFATPILDLAGDDFRILELVVPDRYQVWATDAETDGYVTLVDSVEWTLVDDSASGTRSFDLADVGLGEARWLRLVGLAGGDGPEFDAIEDLHADNHATEIWPTFTEIIGPPDDGRTSELYPPGRALYVRCDMPISDYPGNDFLITEIAVPDAYEVWVFAGEHPAYVTLDTLPWVPLDLDASGTQEFDLSDAGVSGVRWIKLVGREGGDGPEFDAVTVYNDLMEPYPLTSDDASAEISPAWSPDGTAIAYSRVVESQRTIWLLDIATGESSQVTAALDGRTDYAPFWSPESDTIGFHAHVSPTDDTGIWKVPRIGGDASLCVDLEIEHDEEGDWSPSGDWIAFNWARPATGTKDEDLFIVSRDCAIVDTLLSEDGDALIEDQRPFWSPDGTRIGFTRGPDTPSFERYISVYDLEYVSGVPVPVGTPDSLSQCGEVGSGDFSPDGAYIAYDYQNDIWIVPAHAGGVPMQITLGPHVDSSPAWSPDGRTIVFASNRRDGTDSDLWAIDLAPLIVAVGPAAVTSAALPHLVLHPGRPNPVASSTRLSFELDRPGATTLRIYSVSGRLARTLVDAVLGASAHTVSWDGTDARGRRLAPGVYYCRIDALGLDRTQKLTLLR